MQQRLFEITHLLTAKGTATAAELAERFGVSRRTIYRDIDALSSAGIPVYTEKGKGGGIRILPDFILDKALFSADEKKQLLSHLQTLSALDLPDSQSALEKMSAIFGSSDTWLQIDFSPWGTDNVIKDTFYNAKKAILQKKLVSFYYNGIQASSTIRTIEPYLILFKSHSWYLYGFCLEKNDFRFFKLARIVDFSIKKEIFSPRSIPEHNEDSQYQSETWIDFTIKFSPEIAYRVYDEFPFDSIITLPCKSMLVSTRMPESSWLYEYLLSFGANAEILAPEHLRNGIKDTLQKTLSIYD